MEEIALIDFSFMFSTKLYSHLHELENDMAKFFRAQGLEAKIISPTGRSSRKILHIYQKDTLGIPKFTKAQVKKNMANLEKQYRANLPKTKQKPLKKPSDGGSVLKPKQRYTVKKKKSFDLLKSIKMGKFRE